MSKAAFPEGITKWPIEVWENGHQNFKHRFKKNASFKLTLPELLPGSADKYKATTKNFMWLIQYAITHQLQLRAMGNGWSFSEVAVCDGGAVDTKSLRLSFALKNSFVSQDYLNSGKQSADLFFVQCGMSILQLNEKLEAAGRSLKASGASNGQSIAGCISTGTHGAAFKVGAVHDAIVGLHIITGPDRHVWLEKQSNPVASPEFINWLGAEKISDDDMFNAAVVSFGNFGFIHGVLLETEPVFLLEEHKSGEITYEPGLINTMNTLDFSSIENHLPYPIGTSGKNLYHFEVLVNPHDFEAANAAKGVYVKTMYKIPYTTDYTKRIRDSKGFQYGDNTLGLIQTILDALGTKLSAPLIPKLVNAMLPLAFKPAPAAFGTIGETFNNTKFRGKAASAAIALSVKDVSRVLEEIININRQTPFAGAIAFRYVKGTKALLGFTKFPQTCVLEM
ncbi:MAG: FAD-binding protein, partial [Chitinophagaceae bacterium]